MDGGPGEIIHEPREPDTDLHPSEPSGTIGIVREDVLRGIEGRISLPPHAGDVRGRGDDEGSIDSQQSKPPIRLDRGGGQGIGQATGQETKIGGGRKRKARPAYYDDLHDEEPLTATKRTRTIQTDGGRDGSGPGSISGGGDTFYKATSSRLMNVQRDLKDLKNLLQLQFPRLPSDQVEQILIRSRQNAEMGPIHPTKEHVQKEEGWLSTGLRFGASVAGLVALAALRAHVNSPSIAPQPSQAPVGEHTRPTQTFTAQDLYRPN